MRSLAFLILAFLFISAPKANAYVRVVCGVADLSGVYASIDLTAAAAKAKARAYCLRKSHQPKYCSQVQCRNFPNARNVKPYVTFRYNPIHIPRTWPNNSSSDDSGSSSQSDSSSPSAPPKRDQTPSLCPDGHYHTGGCNLCPDGHYHGGVSCDLGPDGHYHGGQSNLCPDGHYHTGSCTLCPDGHYHGNSCTLGPDGHYHGEDE